ncbi:hypothetical protein CDAR_105611 [Caerostris darwini]|uniref:Uncharacterized protein n=1 Tax=Caerostris darwini TaxID=1538125 RepID=A0AAV4UZU7_9ARAC|nr:hypothetical protein CDAR_105611 [Caerostris darwini]
MKIKIDIFTNHFVINEAKKDHAPADKNNLSKTFFVQEHNEVLLKVIMMDENSQKQEKNRRANQKRRPCSASFIHLRYIIFHPSHATAPSFLCRGFQSPAPHNIREREREREKMGRATHVH